MSISLEKLASDDGLELEFVEVCPLCGGTESEFLFWNFDRRYHQPGKFGTHRCSDCDLIRLSPRPTIRSVSRYYPADYGAYAAPSINEMSDKKRIRNALRRSALYKIGYHKDISPVLKVISPIVSRFFMDRATYLYGDLFPQFVENGYALEIGCGNGIFLGYLKRHGWKVTGVDLSSLAASRAKELFDLNVFVGEIEGAPFDSETFDYIHLSHVVEHFYDPPKSMQKIFDLLKPGGVAYIEVPNANGAGAELSGEYWYGWDAPRHLFTFTPETLALAVGNVGFKILQTKTKLWDSFDWAATYEAEAQTGRLRVNRPSVLNGERDSVERQRLRANRIFELDPNRGDFVACWVTKPE